jgi:hypothetical protein
MSITGGALMSRGPELVSPQPATSSKSVHAERIGASYHDRIGPSARLA